MTMPSRMNDDLSSDPGDDFLDSARPLYEEPPF
jgi:hypothetical protein